VQKKWTTEIDQQARIAFFCIRFHRLLLLFPPFFILGTEIESKKRANSDEICNSALKLLISKGRSSAAKEGYVQTLLTEMRRFGYQFG
jgi:hypothetical protein